MSRGKDFRKATILPKMEKDGRRGRCFGEGRDVELHNAKNIFVFLLVANEFYERFGISISWEDPSVGQNNRGEAGDS